jgi:hypothetical protein
LEDNNIVVILLSNFTFAFFNNWPHELAWAMEEISVRIFHWPCKFAWAMMEKSRGNIRQLGRNEHVCLHGKAGGNKRILLGVGVSVISLRLLDTKQGMPTRGARAIAVAKAHMSNKERWTEQKILKTCVTQGTALYMVWTTEDQKGNAKTSFVGNVRIATVHSNAIGLTMLMFKDSTIRTIRGCDMAKVIEVSNNIHNIRAQAHQAAKLAAQQESLCGQLVSGEENDDGDGSGAGEGEDSEEGEESNDGEASDATTGGEPSEEERTGDAETATKPVRKGSVPQQELAQTGSASGLRAEHGATASSNTSVPGTEANPPGSARTVAERVEEERTGDADTAPKLVANGRVEQPEVAQSGSASAVGAEHGATASSNTSVPETEQTVSGSALCTDHEGTAGSNTSVPNTAVDMGLSVSNPPPPPSSPQPGRRTRGRTRGYAVSVK